MTKEKIRMENDDRLDYLWEKYVLECRFKGFSEQTLKNKTTYFKAFLKIIGEEKRARNLSKDVCVLFQKERIKSGIKPISINSHSVVINAFFSWLYKNGYIKEEMKIQKMKVQETVKETYSEDELKILLEKPDNPSFVEYRTWIIVNYILGTGNRIGSILAIRNRDVDLADKSINLEHTKNKKRQIVFLPQSLLFSLSEYMNVRKGAEDDYLFCTEYGEKLSLKGAEDALSRYCAHKGIKSLGHHSLRHSFSKIAVRDCHIDAFRLQRLLGHSDIKTTEHYVRLYSDDLREGLEDYNPLERLTQQKEKDKRITV